MVASRRCEDASRRMDRSRVLASFDSPAELLAAALKLALPRLEPRKTRADNPSAWPLEAVVGNELVAAIEELGVPARFAGTTELCIQHDWDPRPGALDLHVRSGVGDDLMIAAELKLEEVPQAMWDLYKLMAARKLPGSPDTFLLMGAHKNCWAKPCGELFPERVGQVRVVPTVPLFRSNRNQYKKDLAYSGRIMSVPTSVEVQGVATGLHPTHYPTLEFRLIEVRPHDATPIPCMDGWPLGSAPA